MLSKTKLDQGFTAIHNYYFAYIKKLGHHFGVILDVLVIC